MDGFTSTSPVKTPLTNMASGPTQNQNEFEKTSSERFGTNTAYIFEEMEKINKKQRQLILEHLQTEKPLPMEEAMAEEEAFLKSHRQHDPDSFLKSTEALFAKKAQQTHSIFTKLEDLAKHLHQFHHTLLPKQNENLEIEIDVVEEQFENPKWIQISPSIKLPNIPPVAVDPVSEFLQPKSRSAFPEAHTSSPNSRMSQQEPYDFSAREFVRTNSTVTSPERPLIPQVNRRTSVAANKLNTTGRRPDTPFQQPTRPGRSSSTSNRTPSPVGSALSRKSATVNAELHGQTWTGSLGHLNSSNNLSSLSLTQIGQSQDSLASATQKQQK